jgi:flagellar protein FliS
VYTPPKTAAHAYANVGLETGVAAASPQQLVVMLYEGAELAVRLAIQHVEQGDLAKKAAAISKAGAIILEGLRAALDREQGGEIALQLDALYDYMLKRLTFAHLANQTAPLEEVLGLLRELRSAWQQIGGATRTGTESSFHSIAA